MSKPKPGKVVRLNPRSWSLVVKAMKKGESIAAATERLLTEKIKLGKSYFILPESKIVCDSISEAKGQAILRAVKQKKEVGEKPIEVAEIING
jgi:hypothetical protein